MNLTSISYNEGQRTAIDNIVGKFAVGDNQRALLLGAAGTGKTTTFQEILRQLQKERYEDERGFVIAAPTNKAVKVARKMVESAGISGVCFKTIHSLLGLMVDESEGRKGLMKRDIEALHNGYHTIIIDEGSMISSELKESIEMETFGCNVLGVGDQNQLSPIERKRDTPKEEASGASRGNSKLAFFDWFDQTQTFQLTEVMRQKGSSTGPIVDAASTAVERKQKFFDPRNLTHLIHQESEKGVWLFQPEQFYKVLAKAYMAAKEKGNQWDDTKLICYHHRSINHINQFVRYHLFGDEAQKAWYLPGEPLSCLSPVTREHWDEEAGKMVRKIVFPTATDLRVVTAIPKQLKIHFTNDYYSEYPAWEIMALEPESGLIKQLTLLCPSESDKYQEQLDYFKKKALSKEITWYCYYKLKSAFDDVRVGYGITAYAAQGSTYKNVFVVCPDILNVRDQDTQRRAFYVALSRVQDKLILC